MDLTGGCEWVVEAHACNRALLADLPRVQQLFATMIQDLGLHPVAEAQWHKFEGEGGVTGIALLAESHIACHTFPEYGSLCLNLFCCRRRPRWQFELVLSDLFAASSVTVREVDRPYHA
jgi:S-adenosylmethionine decarboxylase